MPSLLNQLLQHPLGVLDTLTPRWIGGASGDVEVGVMTAGGVGTPPASSIYSIISKHSPLLPPNRGVIEDSKTPSWPQPWRETSFNNSLDKNQTAKRQSPPYNKQLKTVMERCEGEKERVFLPKVDREGKCLGDRDYSLPSPPERDMHDYSTPYKETHLSQLSIDGGYDGSQTSLTRSELESYSRGYEDVRPPSHSQQPSYAQSEGYHSYVSSTDSTTPFLDRLREESDGAGRESCASSGSSSETLKWHGSLSDVSTGGAPHHQLIAHSSRVPMPQRHHSESVLYLGNTEPWTSHQHNHLNTQMRRLFPVSTYEPVQPRSPPKLSVAERVCEIERQQQQRVPIQEQDKRARVTDHASLKAIQKKALLSFYERHHSTWKSEPQLTASNIPPQPPPRPQPPPSTRRSSSASDYAGSINRDVVRSTLDTSLSETNGMKDSRHQHSSSCGSLSTAVLGPMIVGPAISVDDWVPARPPKKPHLRAAYPPPRVPSPDLPPPSPPPAEDDEVLYSDEPLPPPPPEEQLSPLPDRPPPPRTSLPHPRSFPKPPIRTLESDVHYENGPELKRHSDSFQQKNGYPNQKDKYNERYVQNRIEYKSSSLTDKEASDKRNYMEIKRYSLEKKMEPQLRPNMLSPPLPDRSKRLTLGIIDQPRSLDSNLTIIENPNEINRPGPQTPTYKKYQAHAVSPIEAKTNYKNIRESFLRPNDPLEFRSGAMERHSLRFSTTTQKLLVNGKIANAVHNGKISPPSRKANLVRTPSDVVRKISYSSGIHHAEPITKYHAELLSKTSPALTPQCPPTSHQLSQSKASYLSYRREPREKGLPQGSYKRTMSPIGQRITDSTVENSFKKDAETQKKIKDPSSPLMDEKTDKEDEKLNKEESERINKSDEDEEEEHLCDKEALSKTLPRNYSVAVGTTGGGVGGVGPTAIGKRVSRPPRAQSDPTCSKPEKKSVCASTQDNLDESPVEERNGVRILRSMSEGGERRRGTSDASSQTSPNPSPPPFPPHPPPPPRRQLQEEIDCEQLSRDLASQLSPSHRLHGILVPGPDVKRSTDYVSGLFRMDITPRSRSSPVTNLSASSQQVNGSETDGLLVNKSYFSSSDCKANSMNSLQQKKEELMQRLTRKLTVLRAESVAVSEETDVNETLGMAVAERVERLSKPQEAAKFRLHVKEVGHITSLLLGLSGRLARAENSLLNLSPDDGERTLLESKRDKLLEQLNEAKQLKTNIDKRSESVSSMLYTYLTGEEYADYDHFINMKSKLLVDSREIAEKIQLGEEQLLALKETLEQVR